MSRGRYSVVRNVGASNEVEASCADFDGAWMVALLFSQRYGDRYDVVAVFDNDTYDGPPGTGLSEEEQDAIGMAIAFGASLRARVRGADIKAAA